MPGSPVYAQPSSYRDPQLARLAEDFAQSTTFVRSLNTEGMYFAARTD